MKFFLTVLVLCSSLQPSQAWAHRDQDRARQALQSGQILPLKKVMEQLEAQYPGQVLEVELEQKGSRWIYEIKWLDANGQMMRFKLDASTGYILSRRVRAAEAQDAESKMSK